jgi:hypothetical protein
VWVCGGVGMKLECINILADGLGWLGGSSCTPQVLGSTLHGSEFQTGG